MTTESSESSGKTGKTLAATFDLESNKLAQEVGGWGELKKGAGGYSCVVVWQGSCPMIYGPDDLEDLVERLERSEVVLSFNGVGFDVPFLEGCLGRKLTLRHHLDLLQLAWDAMPFKKKGCSLAEFSRRTLGIVGGKLGSGADAPRLAETGQWAQLHSYCMQDVNLTRQLFQYAQAHGGVIGPDGDLIQLALPEWFKDVTI